MDLLSEIGDGVEFLFVAYFLDEGDADILPGEISPLGEQMDFQPGFFEREHRIDTEACDSVVEGLG